MEKGWIYRAKSRDCKVCQLIKRCLSPTAKVRTVLIVDGYEALLRARRRKLQWDEDTRHWYSRHRWRVEGVHGEAKTQYGLRRAVRRGLVNVAIQVYMTAIVMNLSVWRRFYLTFCGLKTMCLVSNKNLRRREYSQMDIGVVVKKTDLMLYWLLDCFKRGLFQQPRCPYFARKKRFPGAWKPYFPTIWA